MCIGSRVVSRSYTPPTQLTDVVSQKSKTNLLNFIVKCLDERSPTTLTVTEELPTLAAAAGGALSLSGAMSQR